MKNQKPNVFTIAPYSSFLRELASSLLNGQLIKNFQYDPSNPLSLASVTIYVPTKHAVQSLRSEFFEIIGKKSIILPIIKPLGDVLEGGAPLNADLPLLSEINPPLSGIQRLLELARLIIAWRERLPDSIRDIHPESPLSLPTSPTDAIWLAKNLATVIDIIETEEKDWENLHSLENAKYGKWWFLTLEFLKIASKYWTERLSELNASSPTHYHIALMHAEAEHILKKRTKGPVIIAGSTGSIPATARLMSVIANEPNGVIVLPGLDMSMPENIWNTMIAQSNNAEKTDSSYSMHPQYSLAKILHFLNIKRQDVQFLGNVDEEMRLRSNILSRALFPSENSDSYNKKKLEDIIPNINQAFADVAFIESENEREEAIAIAIALRISLEKPGENNKKSKSALITADRCLAHRVKLELTRFGIDIDISAGIPLSATLQGSILKILLDATLKSNDPVAIAIFIKHPLARFGFPIEDLSRAKNALELIALRGQRCFYGIMELKSIVQEKISEHKKNQYPPHWRSRLSEEDEDLALKLADKIVESVMPLADKMSKNPSISSFSTLDWIESTIICLENIFLNTSDNSENLWTGKEGKALYSFFSKIIESGHCIQANPSEWIGIVAALIAGESVKPETEKSSRIFILGTLESRLLNFDTLILGGLNEGVWPSHIPKNPFLSRMMQNDLGLETAEKRIGQAAHDFAMANGTRRLIYTRSIRENNIPTVASRWLKRLLALGGNTFWDDLKKRGQCYLDWTRHLDVNISTQQDLSKRPRPFPPREIQPKTFSFSEIKNLISDPYAIYAKKILKLDPLPLLKNDPDKKHLGIFFHKMISILIQQKFNKNTPEIVSTMNKVIDSSFEEEKLPPHIDVIWRHRFRKIAYAFLLYEKEHQSSIEQVFCEIQARLNIETIGIKLTGRADRINILTSGDADIIDYKTGVPPLKEAKNLVDPQLALEAAALQAGAFLGIGRLKVNNLLYIRLNEQLKKDCIDNISVDSLVEKALEQLIRFVKLLQDGKNPFISHLRPSKKGNFPIMGEYDHLARVDEWKEPDEN
ncbi:double-strand break repair protein AddB [Candidatus Liberibacter sp.]|uniref:double-strand break repair protein AddB n=1 Tax=Candidatus Liberibacter sp. TaxID=34022 RepID=UPI0015F4C325|nr:double-strand break repair protein AddB [Candidatus Liberibacter sp.]MBA5724295.1 double-strand break repair protein AddB [Candidatus Liberibacter sp.]